MTVWNRGSIIQQLHGLKYTICDLQLCFWAQSSIQTSNYMLLALTPSNLSHV